MNWMESNIIHLKQKFADDYIQEAQLHCDIFRQRRVVMVGRTYNSGFSQNFRLNRTLSRETMLEKFKPRASENYEFEYHQHNESTFRHFCPHQENSVASAKIYVE